jgi:hypothetical protein
VSISCSYCHLPSMSFKNCVIYEFDLCVVYVVFDLCVVCDLRTISCMDYVI